MTARGNVTALPYRAMTERQLGAAVADLCKLLHLLAYHTYDSRRSDPGFPDLVIAGARGLIYRELKSATGRLSVPQIVWRDGLVATGADWAVWRPEDWHSGRIRRELAALTARLGPAVRGGAGATLPRGTGATKGMVTE